MSKASDDIMMAIVFLHDAAFPAPASLKQALSERLPYLQFPDASESGDASLLLFGEGMVASLQFVAAPAPIAENDPAFAYAWYWPDAWSTLRRQKAHIVLSVGGGADARMRSACLANLAAGVISTTPGALGLHWASADAVWPSAVIPSMVSVGAPSAPAVLCVSVKLSRDSGGTISARTQGLAAFGLRELETSGFSGNVQALNETFLDFSAFLIDGHTVEKDSTIGPAGAGQIKVTIGRSKISDAGEVYFLRFP